MSTSEPDHMRFFPKPEPYDGQAEAMDRIGEALDDGRDVLFEGACGTGKTLAALAPALEFARRTDKTVVITTNVHQQMRQFVREAKEIHSQERLRAVVFKGKGKMCHIDVGYEECQALRDNTYELVDAERDKRQLEKRQQALLEEARDGDQQAAEARQAVMDELKAVNADVDDLQEANICERYQQNLTTDPAEFTAWLYDDVRTPEEVYDYADGAGLCGYELLKDAMEGVDLAVCNYHHVLDPGIRAQFFRWLGRDPEDVVIVFDEAHNVEDAAREHASKTLTENSLDEALNELGETSDPRAEPARNALSAFREAMARTYEDNLEFGQSEARSVRESRRDSRSPSEAQSASEDASENGSGRSPRAMEDVGENWEDVPVANEDRRDGLTLAFLQAYSGQGISEDLGQASALGRDLDEAYEEAYKNGEADTRRDCQTLEAAEFVTAYFEDSDELGQYPTMGVRRDDRTGEVYGRAELYTCIPREVTTDLFDAVHSTVLMSATLRPFDMISDVLGLEDPETLAFGLNFPAERRRTYAADTEPLFASRRDDPEVQDEVADVLRDAIRMTPGNCLFFFPSYSEAERYHGMLGDVDAIRYLDKAGHPVEEMRQEFTAERNSALFTSLWGTLAEGVSFDGDDARTVAVVGVPYPHLDERAEAVQDAYDRAFSDTDDAGWQYAVEVPTVRKTRQALGRVIRSPEDFGVRLLVDRRYTRKSRTKMRKYSVNPTFPPEERKEIVDMKPGKVRFGMLNFFGDLDAYGGNPPEP